MFNFSSIFFVMLTSAGQLTSTVLQIFPALSQATIPGLLCFNFVAVLMERFRSHSVSQSVSRSVSQAASQPASQPVSQQASKQASK